MGMHNGPIHIWFERSGGFAGMSVSVEIKSDTLSPDEAKELSKLINRCNFFEFKQDSISTGMPDQYLYRITIEKEGEKKELEFNETAIPQEFRPLIDYLMKKTSRRK